MSWSIAIIENTVKVPAAKRLELADTITRAAPDSFWCEEDNTPEERMELVFSAIGTLIFDEDAMEHMDYLTHNKDMCAALAAAGVVGRVCLGSLEGDNAGDFWGVEFRAHHWRSLAGTLQWTHGTSYPGTA